MMVIRTVPSTLRETVSPVSLSALRRKYDEIPTAVNRMTAAKIRKMFSFMFTSIFLYYCPAFVWRGGEESAFLTKQSPRSDVKFSGAIVLFSFYTHGTDH